MSAEKWRKAQQRWQNKELKHLLICCRVKLYRLS